VAITYFAITSATTVDVALNDAVYAKLRGKVRLIADAPREVTNKWIIVGDNLQANDHAGFRTVSNTNRDTMLAALQVQFEYHNRRTLNDYGNGKTFHIDLLLPRATVNAV